MTINKVIAQIKRRNREMPLDTDICAWCMDVDSTAAEIRQTQPPTYALPKDGDSELLVTAPFEDVYYHYCCAQHDLDMRQYGDYQNLMDIYSQRQIAWAKHYRRANTPKSSAWHSGI